MTEPGRCAGTGKVVVDMDALRRNFFEFRNCVAGSGARIACDLSADAYGLGAQRIAGELLHAGSDFLYVSGACEALDIRRSFPDARILSGGPVPDEDMRALVAAGISFALTGCDGSAIAAAAAAAAECGRQAAVHLELDPTKDDRFLEGESGSVDDALRIASTRGLRLEGLFARLPGVSPEADRELAGTFLRFVAAVEAKGLSVPLCNLCGGYDFIRFPEYRLDLVRFDAPLYGIPWPGEVPGNRAPLPGTVASFRTRIFRVRTGVPAPSPGGEDRDQDHEGGEPFRPSRTVRIATVPAGLLDGIRCGRGLRLYGTVRGTRVPVLEPVGSDRAELDVSAVADAAAGDEVVFGPGSARPADPLPGGVARHCRDELAFLAGLGRRSAREYVKGGGTVAVAGPYGRDDAYIRR